MSTCSLTHLAASATLRGLHTRCRDRASCDVPIRSERGRVHLEPFSPGRAGALRAPSCTRCTHCTYARSGRELEHSSHFVRLVRHRSLPTPP
jgi:hypothetical protein